MKKIVVLFPLLIISFTLFSQINLVENSDVEYVKTTLGSNVNTTYSELLPIISADGTNLYFIRIDDTLGYGGEDIYFSKLQDDNTWGQAENLGSPINNRHNNSLISVSGDNSTIYVTDLYYEDGSMTWPGVSVSKNVNGTWELPKKLPIKDYVNLSFYRNICISNSRKIMLFSIKDSDSKGKNDLYVSFLQEDSTFSKPLNMGDILNTSFDEVTPFLAADDLTLYFSSAGHAGYGDLDVFVTRRLDDTWTNWSKPQNLGSFINTKKRDSFFTVPASGSFAYFCSANDYYGSDYDIFKIELPEASKPTVVALVNGKITDSKTKENLSSTITYKNEGTDEIIGTIYTDSVNGNYQVVLNAGAKYTITVENSNYESASEIIDLTTVEEYKEIEKNISLIRLVTKTSTNLTKSDNYNPKNILFDFNKSSINDLDYNTLDNLVTHLKSNQNLKIEIQGHTDNVGSEEFNLALSTKRAESVCYYLISKGIAKERITTTGLGENKPVTSNDTDENKSKNRRVEFVISQK